MNTLLCVLGLVSVVLAAPSPRVVGGEDAALGEFPYQVSYQLSLDGTDRHFCGAVIVSPTWIVTAGHCITEAPPVGTFKVIAGILDINDTTSGQTINVIKKIIHPDYKDGVNPHDIALVQLESPLEFNDLVQPIVLPGAGAEHEGNVLLSGWGLLEESTSNSVTTIRLQKAELPIVPDEECNKAISDMMGTTPDKTPFDAKANICTGPLTGGKGICSGDSGGPIAQDGTLVGIVSWASMPCGLRGAPSVYSQVSNYIDFIEEYVDDLPAKKQ